MSSRPRIAVSFDPSRWYLRGALRGVTRFAEEQGGWDMLLLRYHTYPLPMANLANEVDGLLLDASESSVEIATTTDLPAVSLALHPRLTDYAHVTHQYEQIGRNAAIALTERGLSQLAVFTTGEPFRLDAIELVKGFQLQAEAVFAHFELFDTGPRTHARGRWFLEDQLNDLADWVRQLPHPCGVLAVDDEHAYRLVWACRKAGIHIPEDIALIGVGNDEFLCDTAHPSISSTIINREEAGYQAAQRLAHLLAGTTEVDSLRLAPLGILHRQSTNILAIDDPVTAAAMRFIWDNRDRPLNVDDVADHVLVSSRTLHRRFLKYLNRTPGDILRKSRLDQVCHLIVSTDLLLVDIAVRFGFSSVSQLSRDVLKHTGMRPRELRRSNSDM